MRAIQNVFLQFDRSQAIAEFGLLASERGFIDLIVDAKIEQAILLRDEQRFLPLQFGTLRGRLRLCIFRLRQKHRSEPFSHTVILNAHAVKQREHLLVERCFGHAHARMAGPQVLRAAVVHIAAVAMLVFLAHVLAGHDMPAVPAGHELAGIGELVALAGAAVEQCGYAVPRLPIDERLVLAGIPLAAIFDFTDVGAVLQNVIHHAARKARHAGPEDQVLGADALNNAVQGQGFVGVQVEDAPNIRRSRSVNLDDAAAVLADVAIAIGRFADEPAFAHAPRVALADIDRLLLGIKAGHVGQRAPHHASGGVVVGGLRHGDERQTVFRFQPLKLDIIGQVTGGAVDLIEEQAVKLDGVLLGVSDQLFECAAFLRLGGGLGNAEETHDLAACIRCVATQGLLLHGQRKPLAFLLAAGDAG